MKRYRRVLPALLVCFLFVGAIASPAYAYIDPNAAGLASQIITPLLVVAAASLTFFRQGIAEVFSVVSRRLRRRADA